MTNYPCITHGDYENCVRSFIKYREGKRTPGRYAGDNIKMDVK